MMKTLLRFALVIALALTGTACGGEAGVGNRDSGLSVFDTGASGRLDVGSHDSGDAPNDTGQTLGDSGNGQSDAGNQPPASDAGPTPQDGGDIVADGGANADGGGEVAADGGVTALDAGGPPPIDRPAQMLVGRQLICDGEVISRVQLSYARGRLIGLTTSTLGEADMTWSIQWANAVPISAEGRDGDGARHRARWAYTRDKLTTASMMGPGMQLDWRFRYNEAQQLTAASFVETVDGVQARQEGRFTHGREGPTMYMDLPIRYLDGRPATVGGERLVYRGEQLASLPGGRIAYTAGRIGQFNDGSGCIYTYRYMPQGEAEYFRDTMPFSGIGSIFGANGRFHGQLDPGRWLYLTLALLVGE